MTSKGSSTSQSLNDSKKSAQGDLSPDVPGLFDGGGELGELMRARDWSRTPLGPAESWPQNLKTCIRIILTSRQPMFVWWGDQLINLYNDAYKSIVGGKHPFALGEPARVVWREIWDQIEPRVTTAMRTNVGTYDESLMLIMERYGYQEETYYTFSYSPVPNDQGGTGGILCANTEDTQEIISERQMSLLRDLATRTADARSWEDACKLSAESLGTNPRDLCFALIYVADATRQSVVLAGNVGLKAGAAGAPFSCKLDGSAVWPFRAAFDSHEIQVLTQLDERLSIPADAWDTAVHSVAVVPIAPSGPNGRAGALVVGLNPFRVLDAGYKGFLKIVAGQISASIANAAAYEEERRRAEALAELDRAKTAFFSNVSHEFRTPLTLMLGPLSDILASSDGGVSAKYRQELEVVNRNGIRLLKLVNALLDFSRLEAGRLVAHYEAVDLSRYTADLASVFRSAMDKAGLQYRVHCAPLPEPVYVDRDMWEKVVLNLISNAFKFTMEGMVEVSLRSEGEFAALTVHDTGAGIPEAELPRIFERFHRVAGTRGRTYEGTGIGLALVDELVRFHGGSIAVESQVGKGTSFTVKLPYGTAHLPQERIASRQLASPVPADATAYVQEALRWLPELPLEPQQTFRDSADEELAGLYDSSTATPTPVGRVLLVDDNRDMREYVHRLLARRYEVITAQDGLEALKLVKTAAPDLLLTDVMMPEMDGFQLLRAVRSDPETMLLPVIMLSARAGEESRAEGMEAGADDYLVKPFTARELMARVGAHLTMKKLREELSSREQQERQRAETAEAQYRRILESISEGFIFIGHDWTIRYANDKYVQLAQRSIQDLIGRNVWELFPEAIDTKFGLAYLEAMRNGKEQEIEDFYEPLNTWFRAHVYPNLDGISILVSDVTELRRQRDALLVSEKLATAGRLASTVAHEINNPLESVINLLYLARTTRQDEERDQYLDRAEREINRVAHIARRTLGFYRESTQVVRVEVGTIFENLLQVYQGKLNSKQLKVATHVDPGLSITARPGELHQVLSNLITNAIDACDRGGNLRMEAKVSSGKNGSGIEISVTDDGIGIPATDTRRLFEPFFTTKKDVGTGLGLWVVKQIIEGHQGHVRIESSTEPSSRGTSVRFFLPAGEEADARVAASPAGR